MKFDKIMSSMVGLSVFVIIAGTLIITYLVTIVLEEAKERKTVGDHFIGKSVVVQKDTLQVTDYSLIFDEFTLSNGHEVSPVFLKKNSIIDNQQSHKR